jgi:hypothetical protein
MIVMEIPFLIVSNQEMVKMLANVTHLKHKSDCFKKNIALIPD